MASELSIDEVYFDRNQLALAFARLAAERGWPVGLTIDPDEPAFPVLYVDTPEGQVSWHLPSQEVQGTSVPAYPGKWDGHSVAERRMRLARLLSRAQEMTR